jgi:hypothetical protein
MKFDNEILRIIEAFNIYPRSKNVQGLQAPVPSTNINSVGSLPMGFKGSGQAGMAPSNMSTILIKKPKKKKIKKKKDSSL